MEITELDRNTTGGQRIEKPFWLREDGRREVQVNAKTVDPPFSIVVSISDLRAVPPEQVSEKIRTIIAEHPDFPKKADSYIAGRMCGHKSFGNNDAAVIPVQAYKVIQ